jgi:hypothetical protein
MKVSECCGVSPVGNGDCDTSDIGICPECGEHCEYVTEDDIPEWERRFDADYIENQKWLQADIDRK